MNDIIQVEELLALPEGSVILVDATAGPSASKLYESEHLTHAKYVNLEQDLSAIDDPAKGGRHPLPSPAAFAELLTKLGIQKDSHVVVYDRLSGANAGARFWWMMKAIGHPQIQLLDGGFQHAKKANYPIEAGITTQAEASTKPYVAAEEWLLPTVNIDTISQWTAGDTLSLIIDVRESARYEGLQEPIDLIAGHIPTAINRPYAQNLTEDGLFKSPEELRKLYAALVEGTNSDNSAIHCGSGVTACHTLLAMSIAGLPLPSLYVGSWSEWSRNKL